MFFYDAFLCVVYVFVCVHTRNRHPDDVVGRLNTDIGDVCECVISVRMRACMCVRVSYASAVSFVFFYFL